MADVTQQEIEAAARDCYNELLSMPAYGGSPAWKKAIEKHMTALLAAAQCRAPGEMVRLATQTKTEDSRSCTCHPGDGAPTPCARKYALTHCIAADLGKRLRHAITTAMNDDLSQVGTDKRKRHCDRLEAMSAAAAFLEDRW